MDILHMIQVYLNDKSDKEDKDEKKKLKPPTSFVADAKITLMAIFIKMIHEAKSVNDDLVNDNIDQLDEIKKKISDHVSEELKDYVSPIIFRICDHYDNKILGDTLPSSGITLNKLQNKLDKYLENNTELQTLIMSEFSKFLRLYAIHVACYLWNEAKFVDPSKAKKVANKDSKDSKDSKDKKKSKKDDEPRWVVSSKATSHKSIKQFLMSCNITLCPSADKISNNQLEYLSEFLAAIQEKEKEKESKKEKKSDSTDSKDKKSKKDSKDSKDSKDKKKSKKNDSDDEDDAKDSDDESSKEDSDDETKEESSKEDSDKEDDSDKENESEKEESEDESPKKGKKKGGKSVKAKESPEPKHKGKNRKNKDD
jgi:hypothetical protein